MKVFLLCLTLVFSLQVNASIDTNKKVNVIGVSGEQAHFSVKEGLSETCKWNMIYFSITSDFGKMSYATLLSAQATNKPLYRIVYSKNPTSELCTMSLIEIR